MSTHRRYRIEVQGRLTNGWHHLFHATQLRIVEAWDGSWVTFLESSAIDQTALHGLLSKVRDLNLVLLSVNPIDTKASVPSDAPPLQDNKRV